MKIAKSILISAFILLTSATFSLAGDTTKAQVLSVSGVVQLKDSQGAWVDVSKGDVLPVGAELSTASGGECQIGFLETQKSAVDVKPGSRVVLDSLNPVRINVQDGKIFSMIKNLKPGSDFVVRTPTAVASARGTGGEHSRDSLIVHDGTFQVEAGGEERAVSEGTGIAFTEQGFGDAIPVSEESRAEYETFAEEAVSGIGEAVGQEDAKPDEKPADAGGPDALASQEGFDESGPSKDGFGDFDGASENAAENFVEKTTDREMTDNARQEATDIQAPEDKDGKSGDDKEPNRTQVGI